MIRELGKGAMGVVYLGRDPVIGRLVALKTIRAVSEDDVEQKEFQERFLREAQAAGILSHPNIVTVHDVGEDSATSTSFIAMEYVEGKNLKQLVTEKTTFGFERIAEIIGQVAEALDYAHRRGIVHRDVKPANIIITPEGQVKITDFGIAKIEKSNLTTTGQFLGTPNYMSPEQVTGDAVDGRSDLFSLGVVLYELLTRKKPFTAENLTSISYKIVHERFVPPETYDAGIPTEFAGVLDKALAKDPAERFQRGNDFALALFEFKAREEERQMLRDLGQMVAEAEKLGPVATVTAPPSTLPAPAPAMPATPALGRSPFEILAAAPGAPAPTSAAGLRSPDDDLATREVHRPLPATAYVAAPAPANAGGGDDARSGGSEDWQLDEPTRSKKGAPPPPPPPPPVTADVDVEASLPGAEVIEAAPPPQAAPAPAGLAVSPFDEAPSERRPDGATEILRIDAIPGLPAPPVADRPTEILKAVVPPVPPAPPVPPVVPPPIAADRSADRDPEADCAAERRDAARARRDAAGLRSPDARAGVRPTDGDPQADRAPSGRAGTARCACARLELDAGCGPAAERRFLSGRACARRTGPSDGDPPQPVPAPELPAGGAAGGSADRRRREGRRRRDGADRRRDEAGADRRARLACRTEAGASGRRQCARRPQDRGEGRSKGRPGASSRDASPGGARSDSGASPRAAHAPGRPPDEALGEPEVRRAHHRPRRDCRRRRDGRPLVPEEEGRSPGGRRRAP